jgi:hypothetical protein
MSPSKLALVTVIVSPLERQSPQYAAALRRAHVQAI